MLQHRSFSLAAAVTAIAFAAVPALASPDHTAGNAPTQSPVAMSGSRQPDREVPVVERAPHGEAATTRRDPAAAPVVRAAVVRKAGFAELPQVQDGTAGFGVQITKDVVGVRHGFHSGVVAPIPDLQKFGFAVVVVGDQP